MLQGLQRNYFFVWVIMLLGIALVLTLTVASCSSKSGLQIGPSGNVPVEGRATNLLCVDSDNGINTAEKGNATYRGNLSKDECFGPYLVEYYCDSGKLANKNIKCNCSKGKCV